MLPGVTVEVSKRMELSSKRKIGILGGGPAGLFMFKRLVESGASGLEVTIFERKNLLGAGMPYSHEGAGPEHITNISGNEIPAIVTSMKEWLPLAPKPLLKALQISPKNFNEYKVMPRLLFGEYLSAQFHLLLKKARSAGIKTKVLLNTEAVDIQDAPEQKTVQVFTGSGDCFSFDAVIICIGHCWPKDKEGVVPNWFDSPYPPSKLVIKANYPVAIKGSSLTAIDAVRTLARSNGRFIKRDDGKLTYEPDEGNTGFRIVMHSLRGLLPGVRFHVEDSQMSRLSVIPTEELFIVKKKNEGFVPLDYLFERNFKQPLSRRNPGFYEQVKGLSVEEFVEKMMDLRESLDAFTLLKAEYTEAEKSIRRRQPVYWKEELALLSYAMNYPAKHLSAEDMLRLKKVLMPLISIVIAFVPQGSARELMALYDAGILDLVAVEKENRVEPLEEGGAVYYYTAQDGSEHGVPYGLYVNATGQPQFSFSDLPFKSLSADGTVSPAYLRFRSEEQGAAMLEENPQEVEKHGDGDYYLKVPGISINDHFQVLDRFGVFNDRIYMMSVPYIGGLNPDYSGLDFCEAASARIVAALLGEDDQTFSGTASQDNRGGAHFSTESNLK